MTQIPIQDACTRLHSQMSEYLWYVATGIAGDELIVYVTKKPKTDVPVLALGWWHGYRVKTKVSGRPRPAALEPT